MSESNAVIWRRVLITFVIAVSLIELSIAASVFGVGWYASLRSYSFVSFLLASLITYWGALVGRKYRSYGLKWITVLAAVFITAISIRFVKTEYPVVKDYHAQIAQRNAEIQEHVVSGSAEPLELSPIPYPSMPNTYAIMRYAVNSCFGKTKPHIAEPSTYFPYEKYGLTKNPMNWKNQVLAEYFKADFDIIGWEEED